MIKKYYSKKYLKEKLECQTYIQIAKENNVDTSTIQRYMRKYNPTNKHIPWSKKEIDLLKNNYKNKTEIYSQFPNRSKSAINHKASRIGIKREIFKRSYPINHDFFKVWTPQMAYILGLFYSDGNVSISLNQAGIHLNQKDHYILEKINSLMSSTRPITIYNNSSYLRFNSKILATDLNSLGCVPRKSKILRFPNIKKEFLSHFVRGYFDGDGSITFNKPNTIKIHIVGAQEFLKEMQDRICNVLKVRKNPLHRCSSIWRFNMYGDTARTFCEWIYRDSKDLYLRRKRNRFIKHKEIRKNGL